MASMPESITVNFEPYPTALEAERRQRHHEVLVAVLVECVRAANRLSIAVDASLPRGEAVIVAGERELRITGLKDGVP
jgi:hypothetical protein